MDKNLMWSADPFWVDSRVALISSMVKGEEILDIGCGIGILSNKLANMGYNITGIDIDPDAIKMAKSNSVLPSYISGDFLTYDFGGKQFDTIIMADVLEHVKDDDGMIDNALTLLRPQGKIIIMVPALPSLFGYHDKEVGHLRRYSKRHIKDKLKEHGMTIQSIRYWNMASIPSTLVYSRFLNRPYPELSLGTSRFLHAYFLWIENKFLMPLGISLVISASKELSG